MSLTIYTAEALSKLPFLTTVDDLKTAVDNLRPLPKDIEDRVVQKLRLDWNYHSNAIEGNQLSYGETVAFIVEGITAKGKTLKDHLDIKGHDEAIKYLLDIIKNQDYILNEADIRNLHKLLLKENYFVDALTPNGEKTRKEIKIGQYKSSANHVQTATGEIHYYATPDEVPMRMGDLMDWYKLAKENVAVHPVVLATLFHHEFTNIHPFDDGNGRMGRLLLNLMLQQNAYPPIVVKQNDKLNYYQVLRQADAGEIVPITEYMSALTAHSLEIYLKAAKGESIEDEDDIDKEIALFKQEANSRLLIKKEAYKIHADLSNLINSVINNCFSDLVQKVSKFYSLFNSEKCNVEILYDEIDPIQQKERSLSLAFKDYLIYMQSLNESELKNISKIILIISLGTLKNGSYIAFNAGFYIIISLENKQWSLMYKKAALELSFQYNEANIIPQLLKFNKERIKELMTFINQAIDYDDKKEET